MKNLFFFVAGMALVVLYLKLEWYLSRWDRRDRLHRIDPLIGEPLIDAIGKLALRDHSHKETHR